MEKRSITKINGANVSFRKIGSGTRKVLFFHGFPGSSAQIELFRPHLEAHGLEAVCFDRPGYSGSIPTGNNQREETTQIARELITELGWTSCELISVSGGTPFLFSLARSFPELVSNITIISGLGPIGTEEFTAHINWRSKLALRLLPLVPDSVLQIALPSSGKGRASRTKSTVRMFLPVSAEDEAVMQDRIAQKALGIALMEAFFQNGLGPKRDAKSFMKPWPVDLGAYEGPITIWHGTDDKILYPSMAKRFATLIPRAELKILENEGHYSLAISKIHEILLSGPRAS